MNEPDSRALRLDPRTALVVIDLQKGVVRRQLAHPVATVVANAVRLVDAFRSAQLPVVLVNVGFAADGADFLAPRADYGTMPPSELPADFSELIPELKAQPSDLRVTKHQWGAFYGTELDLQLRRRGVTGIVLAGISTSIGVESTARAAYEMGFQIVFASDAITDSEDVSHKHSFEYIFPRIGQVGTTETVLKALASRS